MATLLLILHFEYIFAWKVCPSTECTKQIYAVLISKIFVFV